MDDMRDDIVNLEDEIEQLGQSLERARKIGLFAKIVVGGGILWMAAAVVGVASFSPAALLAAIAAVIGGIVVAGSNKSTAAQTEAALQATEARRAELIGGIDLRVVGGSPTLH